MRITTELGVERTCGHCGDLWPEDEEFFPRHKAGPYGFHSWCKACWAEYNAERRPPKTLGAARSRAYRERHRDEYNARERERQRKRRLDPDFLERDRARQRARRNAA